MRERTRNAVALFVAAAAAAVLFVSFDPRPDGSDPESVDVQRATAAVDWPSARLNPSAGQPSAPGTAHPNHPRRLDGREALERDLELLEAGHRRLADCAGYTATFCRCERSGEELGDTQVIQLKLRHSPFSVYMKWLGAEAGREVLYVDGEHDGRMIVRAGGLKGRLLPVLRLDPNGSLATRESRHRITEAGLLSLVRKMLVNRRRDLEQLEGLRCELQEDQSFADRPCIAMKIEFLDPSYDPEYRGTVHFIDREWAIPVLVRNYGWPEDVSGARPSQLDETALVEQYSYTDVRLDAALTADDFDPENPRYGFRR
ncbi:MAG: DUF1571 domain-containing protein [Planctomycetes bacterium]|nr:DUF1571 domain-containing protein [Planctomycetota bacterium]